MEASKEEVKYPDNLKLKDKVEETGITITHIAKKIGYCRKIVSDTLHGHYKGDNVIPLIKQHLNID